VATRMSSAKPGSPIRLRRSNDLGFLDCRLTKRISTAPLRPTSLRDYGPRLGLVGGGRRTGEQCP